VAEDRPHLYIVTGNFRASGAWTGAIRVPQPNGDEEKEEEIVRKEGQTLHRKYTVVVEPDGTEYVEDIEEWVTD
jgi:hypothetical protein